MPGILFVQTDWLEHLGILYLSSYLKEKGIEVHLAISHKLSPILKKIKKVQPELIAASTSTGSHQLILRLFKELKAKINIPTIIGGPHPTFFPEVLSEPQLDFLIRGEGEKPIAKLIEALRGDRDFSKVPNLGYKEKGEPKFNPLTELIEDLDSLPFPDRALYLEHYQFYKRLFMKRVITTRGCPYSCSYCYNLNLKELYKGLGKYVRQRSVENVIAELKQIKNLARTINFVDDSFGLNKEWTEEFLERYRKEIRLPFIINLRPEQLNEDFAKALARANCYCAQIGIESADDELREKLLARAVPKEKIISSIALLKSFNIKVLSYNMLGLPGEDIEKGFQTIRLNRACSVDFPRFSIFQPYPGTKLGEYCLEKKLTSQKNPYHTINASYFRKSPIKQNKIRELENLQKLFLPAIKFEILEPLIRKLVKLPPNPLFDSIFLLSIASQYRKATKLSYKETIELGLRNLRVYFG